MSQLSITRARTNGFDSIHVKTGVVELIFIPELGGKISSLRDARTGREWLWRHPRLAYKRVPTGSSYVLEADTGGWDECFPSVSACEYPSTPWQGAAIQDHGELWSQSPVFEIEEQAGSAAFHTTWQGNALPYTFTRTIHLAAGSSRLRVDYCVTSKADQSINFVWCIHPLLAIEPGMELRLPPAARFNVGGTFPSDLLPSKKTPAYPFSAVGLDFPRLPEREAGISLKIWSDPLPADAAWAALAARDGELRMRWDASLLPQLAVWMNFGAWAADGGTPYFNLGLEPCIGAQDSLADAVTLYDLYASLKPHESKTWWLEIDLSGSD